MRRLLGAVGLTLLTLTWAWAAPASTSLGTMPPAAIAAKSASGGAATPSMPAGVASAVEVACSALPPTHAHACLIANTSGVCGQNSVGTYGVTQITQRLDTIEQDLQDPKLAASCSSKNPQIKALINEMTNALISDNVYTNSGSQNLPNYIRRIQNNDVNTLSKIGLKPSDLRNSSDKYFASVYYNRLTKQYIVANRGTVFSQALNPFAKDNSVITDVRQALGYPTNQYDKNATKLAKDITTKDVIFTGHSLGGGLAALEATISGGSAMTFDAAGVSPKTIARDDKKKTAATNIQNYYTSGEILNQIQGHTLAQDTVCARSGLSAIVTDPLLHYIASYAGVNYTQGINTMLPTAMGSQTAVPLTSWNAGTTPATIPGKPGSGYSVPGSAGATNSETPTPFTPNTCLSGLKQAGAAHKLGTLVHGLNYQLTQLLCN